MKWVLVTSRVGPRSNVVDDPEVHFAFFFPESIRDFFLVVSRSRHEQKGLAATLACVCDCRLLSLLSLLLAPYHLDSVLDKDGDDMVKDAWQILPSSLRLEGMSMQA